MFLIQVRFADVGSELGKSLSWIILLGCYRDENPSLSSNSYENLLDLILTLFICYYLP